MAVVQTDSGVPGANTYALAAEMRAFYTERGVTFAQTDSALDIALVKATDFIDSNFQFQGSKLTSAQSTEFPRRTPVTLFGVSPELKSATYESAQRILAGTDLLPDPNYSQSGTVVEETTKVGPIEQTKKYSSGSVASQPQYPEIRAWLRRTGALAVTKEVIF